MPRAQADSFCQRDPKLLLVFLQQSRPRAGSRTHSQTQPDRGAASDLTQRWGTQRWGTQRWGTAAGLTRGVGRPPGSLPVQGLCGSPHPDRQRPRPLGGLRSRTRPPNAGVPRLGWTLPLASSWLGDGAGPSRPVCGTGSPHWGRGLFHSCLQRGGVCSAKLSQSPTGRAQQTLLEKEKVGTDPEGLRPDGPRPAESEVAGRDEPILTGFLRDCHMRPGVGTTAPAGLCVSGAQAGRTASHSPKPRVQWADARAQLPPCLTAV